MLALNPFDTLISLLALLSAYALQRPRTSLPAGRGWRLAYALGSAALVVAELLWHGLHWQMFPALLVLALCAAGALCGRRLRPGFVARLLSLAGMELAVASLLLCYVLPLFTLPVPTGPYAVGTRTEQWLDPATGRPLAVQFWYPAAPTGHEPRARYARLRELKPKFVYFHWVRTDALEDAPVALSGGPYPVLLFGHMWGGRRTQDTFLAEDLASHGYVVVAPDHPGNAARVQLGNGSVLRSDRAEALDNIETDGADKVRAVWTRELKLWTADNESILNQLAAGRAGWLGSSADMTRVGTFGHSFGGSASLALLGLDPRVKCALNLDGWTLDGLAHRTTQPFLVVYEARDEAMAGGRPTGPLVEDQMERADQDAVDPALRAGGGATAYVGGTQHADFTDSTLYSPIERLTYTGPIAPARVQTIVRGLTLGFFDRNLKGRGQVPGFAEVRMKKGP